MNDSVLSLTNVSKSYGGKPAVIDLDFTIAPHSITGFLGPNGAGKSTSIRMGLGILSPDHGEVRLFGQKPNYKMLDRVGFLPEERGLYRKMKVLAVIAHFARLKGMSAAAAKKNGLALLEQFGLGDVAYKKVRELSKGMAQKVQIIAAIVHEPEFIILDEPFSGLDPVNQQTLEDRIRSLAKTGTTILFSTHVMEHAERLCDKIILLAGGRKIFDGGVDEALATVPNSVILETGKDDDLATALGQLAKTIHRLPDSLETTSNWSVDLNNKVDVQDVLRACVNNKLSLHSFEPARRHLHDVFVHLVADDKNQTKGAN
ncbi:ABC transporter, ATP-binding protein [hydrothermal vent metagenome]|uniref:ABC transporter, ATP-binding protein n=1 Tax=hydrothermal vent metagenome TaxID=652676 RepID=A0A3B0R025_9ZZZZ